MPSLLAIFLLFPLGIDWQTRLLKSELEINGYTRIYGGLNQGNSTFMGQIDDYSAEVFVEHPGGYIHRATLIIDTRQITETNCLSIYRLLQGLLVIKYGPSFTRFVRTDPVIDDLLYAHRCHAIRTGIESVSSIWNTKEFKIELSIFGDDVICIEITYTYKKYFKRFIKDNKARLLKKL